jgi:predicted transcriptional regulator
MGPETKRRLDLPARRGRAFQNRFWPLTEQGQLCEIQAGLNDLDHGDAVSHERVAAWLRSWGKPSERKPPR